MWTSDPREHDFAEQIFLLKKNECDSNIKLWFQLGKIGFIFILNSGSGSCDDTFKFIYFRTL